MFEVTFGKMLPDQFLSWSQTGYEWVSEEIHGADFSTLLTRKLSQLQDSQIDSNYNWV
jgi:hypothetical protein